ncbi:hypothetical protein BBK82_38310 [Lentzea guizhouensis]|uniref:LRV domain-containing protein n=1 Tax=Lentzea guizhouensis TaxID=1586287 RepID=A0A1B2HTE7_9PSEU|nr:hypothetical protein [Lentzea guizhouensis]ANZ40972.1 hypothetical protein BBK82_38310 [Lentzea guizhouensis]
MGNLPVLCGLAANPSAPHAVLLRLADHPQRDSLLPSAALLDRTHLPAPVAEVLAVHDSADVRHRLAAHPSTPEAVRVALAGDDDPDVRREVARWPGSWLDRPHYGDPLPAEPLPEEVYLRLAADPDADVRSALGQNHYIPQAVRVVLAGDDDSSVRSSAALDEMPAEVLHGLMADQDRDVRITALRTTGIYTPTATITPELAALYEDEEYFYDSAVTLVELNPELLARLLTNPSLHRALAANPSLPIEQMQVFLQDTALRVALADNPHLPEPILEALVATNDPAVHNTLLRRSDLPSRFLQRLTAFDDNRVTVFSLIPARASTDELLPYLDHPNPNLRYAVTLADDLPPSAVQQLAADPDVHIRFAVCLRYDDVQPAVLVDVLDQQSGRSRLGLLRHPRLPVETVRRHARAEWVLERHAIADRADLPADLVLQLLEDDELVVREAAAANPCLPHDRLRQLLAEAGPSVRQAAASNPSLSAGEIEELLATCW